MPSIVLGVAALLGAATANPLVWPRNDQHGYYPISSGASSPSSVVTSGSQTSYNPITTPGTSGGSGYSHPPISTGISTLESSQTSQSRLSTGGGSGFSQPPLSTGSPPISTSGLVPPNSSEAVPTSTPTTITSSTYSWVPCSTSVGQNGVSVVYSTYLTATWFPTVVNTWVEVQPTPTPTPLSTPLITSVSGTFGCPAPTTVTETVYVTTAPPASHGPYETKTYTITETGTRTIITVTVPVTQVPNSQTEPSGPLHSTTAEPHSSIPTGTGYTPPPLSTGTGSPLPPYSISAPYPTYGHSSVPFTSSRVGPKPTGYTHWGYDN